MTSFNCLDKMCDSGKELISNDLTSLYYSNDELMVNRQHICIRTINNQKVPWQKKIVMHEHFTEVDQSKKRYLLKKGLNVRLTI